MDALTWSLVRTTEQAALAAWPEIGCGDKNKIDGLAVAAMRGTLNRIPMQGRIVIGEGEIDKAPMLWIGEDVGTGQGPVVDIAVDPIEGTRMVALGQSNALAVMAFSPRGSLFHAPDMYMRKLVVNHRAKGSIDLSLSLEENLRNIAQALGKPLEKLRMATLDKPRSQSAIEEAARIGVKVYVLPDGDVAASILTCQNDNQFDVMFTIGGAPEGVISACAVKVFNGDMQVELIDFCEAKGDSSEHRSIAEKERSRCAEMGVDVNRIYYLNDLVSSNDVLFCATGVTTGDLLDGVQHCVDGLHTQTLLICGANQTCNVINSVHSC